MTERRLGRRDRSDRTVALIGGAAIVAFLLLRGRGSGKGRSDGQAQVVPPGTRCTVWIRSQGIEVDGVAADLATVVARCRAAGAAEVHATGGAIASVVHNVIKELHAAGVKLHLPSDLLYVATETRP